MFTEGRRRAQEHQPGIAGTDGVDGNSRREETLMTSIQETDQDESMRDMLDTAVMGWLPREVPVCALHLNSPAVRLSTKLARLPMEVYKHVCRELNIRRDEKFDDFRMLAEKVGFSRDQIREVEKSENPSDIVLVRWPSTTRDATVGNLIELLKEEGLERRDVAKILEDWVYKS